MNQLIHFTKSMDDLLSIKRCSHLVTIAVEDVALSARIPLARNAGGGRPRGLVVAGDAGPGHQLQTFGVNTML